MTTKGRTTARQKQTKARERSLRARKDRKVFTSNTGSILCHCRRIKLAEFVLKMKKKKRNTTAEKIRHTESGKSDEFISFAISFMCVCVMATVAATAQFE